MTEERFYDSFNITGGLLSRRDPRFQAARKLSGLEDMFRDEFELYRILLRCEGISMGRISEVDKRDIPISYGYIGYPAGEEPHSEEEPLREELKKGIASFIRSLAEVHCSFRDICNIPIPASGFTIDPWYITFFYTNGPINVELRVSNRNRKAVAYSLDAAVQLYWAYKDTSNLGVRVIVKSEGEVEKAKKLAAELKRLRRIRD